MKRPKTGEHSGRDLRGVQLDHTINELQEGNYSSYYHVTGHDYIMTFKDSSVLMADDEEELLENIELQSSFKQKMSERRKVAGYEDDTNKKVLP